MGKRRLANIPVGSENPLNFAIQQRDKNALTLVNDAVAHGQTLLAYQPVMRSDAMGKPAFYEGLIRVLDDTGRVIPAGQFIDAIEKTETGRAVDVLSLEHGLAALTETPGLRLALNMSARSIGYEPWKRTLDRALAIDPTIGPRLILEITETSAMVMPELVIDFMDRLQPHGICFALDDFGAGHTAIRYFKDFYFDILKIDGQFIRGIAHDADNRALVGALLSIARHFDMLTVAEFVESHEDALVLADMGVDCLQGYYFAAPTTQPEWAAPPPREASA
ncbi:EAL domain-containing protein [Sulfitobacter sp. S190]|uniref:EAL domain-containing protein n=1 Tax=Sulfitobacter sp. S190 TaxID=2867022 RepID=UPI0021A6D30D|nr:EAL domain-containing protein [Sulfitobacter sp. S190]UWR24089.1 EAL domain-containing protein [Sulfitobacter sp. S190]